MRVVFTVHGIQSELRTKQEEVMYTHDINLNPLVQLSQQSSTIHTSETHCPVSPG